MLTDNYYVWYQQTLKKQLVFLSNNNRLLDHKVEATI